MFKFEPLSGRPRKGGNYFIIVNIRDQRRSWVTVRRRGRITLWHLGYIIYGAGEKERLPSQNLTMT
jgi:hypothetical protein